MGLVRWIVACVRQAPLEYALLAVPVGGAALLVGTVAIAAIAPALLQPLVHDTLVLLIAVLALVAGLGTVPAGLLLFAVRVVRALGRPGRPRPGGGAVALFVASAALAGAVLAGGVWLAAQMG